MGRPRRATTVNMGGRYEAALATKFMTLAKEHGVSMKEALRRLMVQAILEARIPGIDALDLETREKEKWGEATPTYAGETTPRKREDGKVVTQPPAE